jgi:lipoprotein NlpD
LNTPLLALSERAAMEMMNRPLAFSTLLAAFVLAGCANPLHRAPVEDRSTSRAPSGATPPAPSSTATTAPAVDAPKPLPAGAENAGKPGYYTIKPGDTVLRVALETGQNWRDIVRWNNMDNPNVIEVGQVLRVAPPGADAAAMAAGATAAKPVTTPKIETKPLEGAKPATAASAPIGAAAPAPAAAAAGEDEVSWAWPAQRSSVAAGFEETRSKGLVFVGKAGDPVLAAADGKVIYAGNGLRGYGNLVIVKHNNTYLTTYAHNQALLVKEDQNVKRGQKIAEMGATDAERVQLQFELRRQGKPVDPARLLPPR